MHRCTAWFLAALIAAVGTARVLHAQTYVATASCSASGSAFATGYNPGSDSFSVSDFNQSFSLDDKGAEIGIPAGATTTIGSGGGLTNVFASGGATAYAGVLRGNVVGGWTKNWDQQHQLGTALLNEARVQARWQDTMILSGVTPGQLWHIHAKLRLHGSFSANLTPPTGGGSQTDPLVSANGTLDLTATGSTFGPALPAGPWGGHFARYFKTSNTLLQNLDLPVPDEVAVDLYAFGGQPVTMDFKMDLYISGTARNEHSYFNPGGGAAFISGDFGSTITWGGISSIVNDATGDVAQNWSVSSASGADYAQPINVPEPRAVALWLILLQLVLRRAG